MKKQVTVRMSHDIFIEAKKNAKQKDCSVNSILLQWIKKGMSYVKETNPK